MLKFLKQTSDHEAERRRFERLSPEENFLVEFRKEAGGSFRLGEGRDISEGGIRFATVAPVRKDEQLSVILYFPKKFPGPRKAEGQVTVRRAYTPGPAHRFRVACEFASTQPSLQQAVIEYLQWNRSSGLALDLTGQA